MQSNSSIDQHTIIKDTTISSNIPKFIAEIGTSHGGDISHAKELIVAAVESGATMVKFQWVIADEIVLPNAGNILLPGGSTNIYESFKKVEQSFEFYTELKEFTETHQVDFLCSVFGSLSLSLLLKLQPNYIKIASPEVNYISLIHQINEYSNNIFSNKKIQNTKSPFTLIISDGISSYMDIARIFSLFPQLNIVLLRCVTQYPSPTHMYQLSRMQHYKKLFNCPIGISDHSTHPIQLPLLASQLGAEYIEKHFTLSRNNTGLDDSYALIPEEFKQMVSAITDAKKSKQHTTDATHAQQIIEGKGHCATLLPIYYTTRRSAFCNIDLPKGSIITHNNTSFYRSETNIKNGIPAEYFPIIQGYKINKDMLKNQAITWECIELL